MTEKTWLENSGEAIKQINLLDHKIRKAKLNYTKSIQAGVGDSIIQGYKTRINELIKFREGFKTACDVFSR